MTAPIPARGAEVVGKFATQHKTDIVFGTLFSHVVIGSAPAAGEAKIPYFVVSEGHHVASTKLNRYCLPARHHRREEPGHRRWRRGSRPMPARR